MKHFFQALSALLSRRLVMAIIALYMLRNGYWGIITTLLTITDPAQITAYQALSIAYLSAIVGIVMWYIGNTTWKGGFSVAANLQNALTSESEKRESHEVIENIVVDETAKNENLREHRKE